MLLFPEYKPWWFTFASSLTFICRYTWELRGSFHILFFRAHSCITKEEFLFNGRECDWNISVVLSVHSFPFVTLKLPNLQLTLLSVLSSVHSRHLMSSSLTGRIFTLTILPPPVSTPVTAGWSCGAMCQVWPRVFLDGCWPLRAAPPAFHDCLFLLTNPPLLWYPLLFSTFLSLQCFSHPDVCVSFF